MKKLFLICLSAGLMCTSMSTKGQNETLKNKYESETILLRGNKNQYIKNNERKKIGLWGMRLNSECEEVSPECKTELDAYQTHRKKGVIMLIGGGTVLISALVIAPFVVLPVFAITAGAGLGGYYTGAFHIYSARKHLQKTIWLRNRDILIKP